MNASGSAASLCWIVSPAGLSQLADVPPQRPVADSELTADILCRPVAASQLGFNLPEQNHFTAHRRFLSRVFCEAIHSPEGSAPPAGSSSRSARRAVAHKAGPRNRTGLSTCSRKTASQTPADEPLGPPHHVTDRESTSQARCFGFLPLLARGVARTAAASFGVRNLCEPTTMPSCSLRQICRIRESCKDSSRARS